jgi:adhesin transport system membrane fusion protein
LSALVESRPFQPSTEDLADVPDIVSQEQRLYDASMDSLGVKLSIAEQQLTQRREELAEQKAREQQLETELNLADQELSVTRPMIESGAVAQIEILRLEREVNRAEGELRQTRAKIQQTEAAIGEAIDQLSNVELDFVTEHREQLAETMTRLSAVEEAEEGLSDRVRQTQVVAPVAGTIKQLFFNTVGGVVLPGRDVVEIVPRDDTLLVQVRIRPQDIAFLAPGQLANVKVSAYDFVVYGGLNGFVEQISADTVLDEDGDAYYEVTIRTERAAFAEDQPIIPGMTVEADIVTGKKTVLAYLMKPVLRAHQRSLSER